MMTRRARLFSFGLIAACGAQAFGCAQPRPFDDLWVAARPYQAELAAARPPSDALDPHRRSADASAPRTNPTGEITLGDAVGLALAQNPSLRAAGWAVAAAEADALQAARPPNPRAGFSAENFAGPSAGAAFERQNLRLSQVIELAGKRSKRLALGEATQRLAAWDYETLRMEVAAAAASRFVSVVIAQQRVALAEDQLRLAEAGHRIADERVKNEIAPGLERDQAAARVALSRIALERARQQLAADKAELAASWGAEHAAFESAAGALDRRVDPPTLDELDQRLAQSPQVARWTDEIAQRQRAVALQKANAVADPSVGVGLRYFPDADDTAGVVELSVPLTVFDDNRHGVLAARLRVAQARAQQQDARASASQALARAHARLQSAAYALGAFDDDALPASESAYRAAVESYDAGLTDYLTVLDAERTLLDIRDQRLDATRAYHLAVIEIETLTAQPIERTVDD